jgi:putative ABC transport system substrate-binding protein
MVSRWAILSLAALFALSAAYAQPVPNMLRVGFVGIQPREAPIYAAFIKKMSELGYVEGRNFAFEFIQARNADDYPSAYTEVVGRRVDIVMAAGNELALRAALVAAGNIPVVFIAVDFDPWQRGYVANLARPATNITGIFVQQLELAKKRVEFVREILPDARQLGLLFDIGSRDQAEAAAEAAQALGFEARLIEVTGQPPDYPSALARMDDLPGAPIVIPATPIFFRDRTALMRLLLERHIPSISAFREAAEAGSLMSYGVELSDLFREVSRYIDRVARGARPSELPIEPPTKFDFVVNLKTMKALGLNMPPTLIARADEVIE